MDKEFIEEVARSMHRQHAKEMLGALQKWEKLSPDERSTWRLISRTTIILVQERSSNPKRKTETRKA